MAGESDKKVTKVEVAEKLKKRVSQMREKAAKDYTEEEINEKIADVFNGYNWEKGSDLSQYPALFYLSFAWKALKISLLVMVLLMLIVIGTYIAANNNPYLSRKMRDMMHDRNVAYVLARYMRKISLPLHGILDLKRAQKWECLVQNPFYKPEEPNCELCELPLEIVDIPATSKDAKRIPEGGEPCIIIEEPSFKNLSYSYMFLRDFYYKNKEDLDFSACEIYGNTGKQKLEDYFKSSEDDIIASKQTFGWKNCRIEGTRALRKLFRRPNFVPLMSEIYLEKHLFIIHQESQTKLVLPSCGTSNCFIAQVHGSSKITLEPFDGCKKNCTGIEQTDLKVGEIFYYPDQPWSVKVEANSENLSIIYRSDFS